MTRVAVVGGGIGGLTAALTLVNAGVDVELYEQSPQFGEVGAGIGLFPNATRLLTELGLGSALEQRAVRQSRGVFRRWSDGQVIGQVDERDLEQRFGAAHFTIHRADLADMLRSSIPRGVVHLGKRLIALTQNASEVELRFDDGSHVRADIAIGADGITSTVASDLGIATKPVSSGYAAYRALVPAERIMGLDAELADTTATTVWLGPDMHFSHYWVRSGRLLNFIGAVHSQKQVEEEAWTVEGDMEELRTAFREWHATLRAVLDGADTVMLFGLFHRLANDRWNMGRVALLGDAAHPMLPFVGQGGAMAMEDAETLAVLLESASADEIPERLDLYSALRWERARRCQEIGVRHATVWELPDGPEQEQRDARIAAPTEDGTGSFFAPSAWLYSHNAGEAARDALSGGVAR